MAAVADVSAKRMDCPLRLDERLTSTNTKLKMYAILKFENGQKYEICYTVYSIICNIESVHYVQSESYTTVKVLL